MSKIIIFNGPPKSGKDTACEFLLKYSNQGNIAHVQFKDKLINLTCEIYSLTREFWDKNYAIREIKESPQTWLNGVSMRDALINVSENVIKPAFGKDYFGRALASLVKNKEGVVHVCSDGGFNEEIVPLNAEVGVENVIICRIYRDGCTFDGDSRNYLSNLPNKFYDVNNNSSLDEFYDKILCIYGENK